MIFRIFFFTLAEESVCGRIFCGFCGLILMNRKSFFSQSFHKFLYHKRVIFLYLFIKTFLFVCSSMWSTPLFFPLKNCSYLGYRKTFFPRKRATFLDPQKFFSVKPLKKHHFNGSQKFIPAKYENFAV